MYVRGGASPPTRVRYHPDTHYMTVSTTPRDAERVPDDMVRIVHVMSHPVMTIEANASLAAARDLLHEHGVHHLVVLDRGQMIAVISDRDVLRALSPFLGTIGEQTRDTRTLLKPVYQLATYHPVTVRDDATVAEASALMLNHEISCLPVLDAGGRLVGVVTTRDLMRGMLGGLTDSHAGNTPTPAEPVPPQPHGAELRDRP